jgi:hypothetical protein
VKAGKSIDRMAELSARADQLSQGRRLASPPETVGGIDP